MSYVVILLFLLAPMISSLLIFTGMVIDVKKRKTYCILLTIVISIIAYNLIPNSSMDLYRYYGVIDYYKTLDFTQFVENFVSLYEPLSDILFFIIAKINIPNLLPFLSTFVFYSLFFKIVFKEFDKYETNPFTQFIIIYGVFCLNLFIDIISGVRFALGLMVFVYAFYNEFMDKGKKSVSYFLYAISVLIHASMIIAVLIRCTLNINKFVKYMLMAVVIIFSIFPNLLIDILSIFANISFVSNLIKRFSDYVSIPATISNLYIAKLLLNVFIFFTAFTTKTDTNDNLRKFLLSTCFISFCFYRYWTIGERLVVLIVPIFLLFAIKCWSKKTNALVIIYLMFCLLFTRTQYKTLIQVDGFNDLFGSRITCNISSCFKLE